MKMRIFLLTRVAVYGALYGAVCGAVYGAVCGASTLFVGCVWCFHR